MFISSYDSETNKLHMETSISSALGLDRFLPHGVFCTVGAGGKTTTTLKIAEELFGDKARLCDKSCDKSYDESCDKSYDESCVESCDESCDESCVESCVKSCVESCVGNDGNWESDEVNPGQRDGNDHRYTMTSTDHILVTTTTHMLCEKDIGFMMPDVILTEGINCQLSWAKSLPWKDNPFLILGCDAHNVKHTDKLKSLPDDLRVELERIFYATVIEADGARRLPFKIPGTNEPVIPPETDMVLIVMGLSAINKPLNEIAFRSDEMAEFLCCGSFELLTPNMAARVISEVFIPKIRKLNPTCEIAIVINQADNEYDRSIAIEISALIYRRFSGNVRILVTSHKK